MVVQAHRRRLWLYRALRMASQAQSRIRSLIKGVEREVSVLCSARVPRGRNGDFIREHRGGEALLYRRKNLHMPW